MTQVDISSSGTNGPKPKGMPRFTTARPPVCKAANDQPFKYLCKYFDIDVNEETLSHLENALNNYLAAYQGKILLEQERDRLMQTLTDPLPSLFYKLNKSRLEKSSDLNLCA